MRFSWHHGCLILGASALVVLLLGALLGIGVVAHVIVPPTVLVRSDVIWVGDLCRATQSSTIQYIQPCPPGYTLDLLVYRGETLKHYTLLHLPR